MEIYNDTSVIRPNQLRERSVRERFIRSKTRKEKILNLESLNEDRCWELLLMVKTSSIGGNFQHLQPSNARF